jgi:hypothetical protein
LTPAYKVRYTAKAGVYEFPLPHDFKFPPLDPPKSVFGILASQQFAGLQAIVQEYIDDDAADAVKHGRGKRVYSWGTVFYRDVSEIERCTEFSHSIYWIDLPDGRVVWDGHYGDRHNEAI